MNPIDMMRATDDSLTEDEIKAFKDCESLLVIGFNDTDFTFEFFGEGQPNSKLVYALEAIKLAYLPKIEEA